MITSENTSIKQMKTIILVIIITMLILASGFAYFYKKNQQQIQKKDQKIDQLVEEIGEIKDQNEQIYQLFNQTAQVDLTENATQMRTNKLPAPKINIKSYNQESARLLQTNSGTTTFLILGINKGLTDSIILMIANDQDQQITTINIPRDLYYNGRKINELYQKYGIENLKQAITKITGFTPDRYATINLKAFVDIIDTLGGVDLTVEKNLYDNLYPNEKGGYTVVSFKKGDQHMDGETALKFARSRETSSDFDRSKRQQLIIAAVKKRVLELNFIENLGTAMKTFETVSEQIQTDITALDAITYLKKYSEYQTRTGNIISNQNLLYSTISSGGQYILLPKKGDYSKILEFFTATIFGTTTTLSSNPA